jgi:hypothetical protein
MVNGVTLLMAVPTRQPAASDSIHCASIVAVFCGVRPFSLNCVVTLNDRVRKGRENGAVENHQNEGNG